jgi:hypothetical protein
LLEAKPNRDGLKGRRACKRTQTLIRFNTTLVILLLTPDATLFSSHRRMLDEWKKWWQRGEQET